MTAEDLHVLCAARDDAALGPAEQLIAAEEREVDAGGDALLHGGLVGEPEVRGIDEAAAAQVIEKHESAFAHEAGEVRQRRFSREPDDAEIRGVHAQDGGRLRRDGICVIAGVCAVGGADLDEPGAALPHDVGDAEAATDLHSLAARDDHLPVPGEDLEGHEQTGGVVVDDEAVFRAGGPADEVADMLGWRLAAPSWRSNSGCCSRGRPLPWRDGALAQRRAAQVRLQDDAARVDHWFERRPAGGGKGVDHLRDDLERRSGFAGAERARTLARTPRVASRRRCGEAGPHGREHGPPREPAAAFVGHQGHY
jgi:hypothetical protein